MAMAKHSPRSALVFENRPRGKEEEAEVVEDTDEDEDEGNKEAGSSVRSTRFRGILPPPVARWCMPTYPPV